MQQTFTKQFMQENCGCYKQINGKLDACSFMQKETISLSDIVNSEIPLKDKYWFVCKKLATKEENQQIAIKVAEIVLPLYEKKYPDNKAPREAIEAANKFIGGHISLNVLIEKRRAADADADADAAAYAAAAAAYAAATAYAAAYAAATADDAATAAAADAAYAAATAEIKQQLFEYLVEITNA